jgi:cytidylate kinase
LAKIRISKRDKEEYTRLRKNALAKMRRLRTKYGIDVEDIPLPNLQALKRVRNTMNGRKKLPVSLPGM